MLNTAVAEQSSASAPEASETAQPRSRSTPEVLRVSIVGGSGYVGGELLRLAAGHPHLEVAQLTSERLAGRFAHTVHPNHRPSPGVGAHGPLKFQSIDDLEACDVLFLCLPHGRGSSHMGRFAELADTVIDCSADFRLRCPDAHRRWYGRDVDGPWRERFVYGLPELERDRLVGARLISGVGCNATAVNLALWPLAQAGWIDRVVVEVKVGSSEGGAQASAATHHPERSGAVRSFAPVGHRHQAEIHQQLGLDDDQLFFSATAIEAVRGVLATHHVFLNREVEDKDLWRLFRRAYGREPFVRIVNEKRGLYRLPEPKILAGTNFCDIGWRLDDHGRRLVVISALDNLVKGAAGSAIQALNVTRGFAETTGLEFAGLHPC